MISYETLDAIADAYIPMLAPACLALTLLSLRHGQSNSAARGGLGLGTSLALAYSLMFIDEAFQIWPRFGLDYSTHTAVALALVSFLSINAPRIAKYWLASLVAYAGLMQYQGYHSAADIISTAIVLGLPMWFCLRYYCRKDPASTRTKS